MEICKKCGSEYSGGRCGACAREYNKQYYIANKERMNRMSAEWRVANKQALSETQARWVEANPEKVRGYKRKWKQNNRDKVYASCVAWRQANPHYKQMARAAAVAWRSANKGKMSELGRAWRASNRSWLTSMEGMRRSLKAKATPEWADEFIISEIYDLADLRSRITGIPWQVDHIVPIKSRIVCGLHTDANLRVITALENSSKGNRWWPNMP